MTDEWMKARTEKFVTATQPKTEPAGPPAPSPSLWRADQGMSRKTERRLRNAGYTPGLPFGGTGPRVSEVIDKNPESPTFGQKVTVER